MLAQTEQSLDLNNAIWYLGIDFATTGVSAVLLNLSTAQRYPLFWSNELSISQEQLQTVNPQLAIRNSAEELFRLPAVTYSGEAANKLFVKFPVTPIIVGSLATKLANNQPGIFLENFKPYLNIGIPYYSSEQQWQPQLQLPNNVVSLYWVRRTLQALLATLSPKSTLVDSVIKLKAVGLTPASLGIVLGNLAGVILGSPASWGDTYRFNLREAVLDAKLVKHPEQIFFLEDAIATILAILPNLVEQQATNSSLAQWQGGMLAINLGATTTELALVDLPNQLNSLTYKDFSVLSLAYGSDALAQDIFCQLLYPQLSAAQLQLLSLDEQVELPEPAQPELQKRDRLSLILQSSAYGRAMLKASSYLQPILQHKAEFTLELGADRWLVKAIDLESKVISPFLHQLNQGLIKLLVETGLSEATITQVIAVVGTVTSIEKWLKQRLPVAKIVQDSLKNSQKSPENADSCITTSGWVATGLATLPLYPQILNRARHQYSDYFLLLELIRAFPQTSQDGTTTYSLEEIIQQLELRGLNTSTCYQRLVHLIKSPLSPGLLPTSGETSSRVCSENILTDFSTEPLFEAEGNAYRLNLPQQQRLANYLSLIVSGASQKLTDPLYVKWRITGKQ